MKLQWETYSDPPAIVLSTTGPPGYCMPGNDWA
jgi:hypothetical protein